MRRWQVVEDLCRRIGARRIAELGVYKGQTLGHLLRWLPDLHVVAVDIWRPGDPAIDTPPGLKKTEHDLGGRAYLADDHEGYYRHCLMLAELYHPRVDILRMTTLAAADRVENGSLDLVFIDADHRPDAVEADIRAWAPKLRPGGIVSGHDYDLPALGRRVQSLFRPGSLRLCEDSVWWAPVGDLLPRVCGELADCA